MNHFITWKLQDVDLSHHCSIRTTSEMTSKMDQDLEKTRGSMPLEMAVQTGHLQL